MMHLYCCEITHTPSIADFGDALTAHIQQKKHPHALRSSCTAWKLLELALRELGIETLPEVSFTDLGKPCFENNALHFSLSHSGDMAAAIIGDEPCAVDIEILRPDVEEKLRARCMHPEEIQAGCDFFEIWTRKECIAKLDGSGMPSHPKILNTLDARYQGSFFTQRITDSAGKSYMLSALCEDADRMQIKRTIIEG